MVDESEVPGPVDFVLIELPADAATDPIQHLKDLADLKAQGILTEEELAAQKARTPAF